ncbi:transcriptional regulator [Allochromatium palmeri]|uniref:Transcriptional regulator n=1 Tax=Allochromatium palmeri TaxID=231048 RepID=A0A6N8EAT5_9GAMM|nr:transcriptional regulator [Allochromatium palmeri]MTW20448.1 transcriptional regulator [Allochromatium palmeri]
MQTLIIDVATIEEVKASMKAAFRGEPQGCRYSFASEERLLEVLNGRRWAILKVLAGQGPVGMRELARRLGRDIKPLSRDTKTLTDCGLIDKQPDGKVEFPYNGIDLAIRFRNAA